MKTRLTGEVLEETDAELDDELYEEAELDEIDDVTGLDGPDEKEPLEFSE